MMSRIQNLCILLLLFFASCERNDENIYTENGDGIKMDFSFSPQISIINDMEHVPMDANTRDSEGDITITNWYRVLIAKKIDSKWILDRIIDKKFDPTDIFDSKNYYVADVLPLMNFSVVLRPGEYRMTVFTGAKSVIWNSQLKEGAILQDLDAANPHPIYACTYRTVENGYLNVGAKCLDEEIFTGTKDFIVERTEDLHSNPIVEDNHVPLYRRVAKLRIMLKNELGPGITQGFFTVLANGISANVKITDDKQFCYGLNVWGGTCYRQGNVVDEMKYGSFTWDEYQTGSDGAKYLFGMRSGSRQLSIFYFVEDGISIPVSISDVNVTVNQYIPQFSYTKETAPIMLKYNHITSIAFKPNGDEWVAKDEYGNDNNYLGMDVVGPGGEVPTDLTDLFPFNYEYIPRN